MKAKHPNRLLSSEEAAAIASQRTGLGITRATVDELVALAILPNFGTSKEPRILEEHARVLTGLPKTEIELAVASLQASGAPPAGDLDGQTLIQLSAQLAVSFDPDHQSITSLQAFIRALQSDPDLLPSSGDYRRTLTHIKGGPFIWASENSRAARWEAEWRTADSHDARTTAAEALCVPMLFGSKARLSSFIVSCIRQNLSAGAPICDLMAGTGLVTRQLLQYYTVHANDAALFASRLSASQAVEIDEPRFRAVLAAVRPFFDQNQRALKVLFKEALELEEAFLLGGLSAARLTEYRGFVSNCTRFVPGFRPPGDSLAWTRQLDEPLRARVEAEVLRGKQRPYDSPFVLAAAYWGNCYFGLRQAAEIDSLRFALDRSPLDNDRPLVEAVFLAAADACASTPHYAQPPKAGEDSQVSKLIEKRAKDVFSEFELRLSLACKRPRRVHANLSVTNLPWAAALDHFARKSANAKEKAVYVDPPYSRLQYSRFYHVLDTLLRYDYPACERTGRTPESSRRFTSAFDRRESTVVEEFHRLFQAVNRMRAKLFLSYSTAGTVGADKLLELANAHFGSVEVYTAPLQHHSQGVPLQDRGHRLELLVVAAP